MISAERKYDLLFTNNGIAMIMVEGAVKMGVGGGGLGGAVLNKVIRDKRIDNERAEPLELLRVQGFEMVRASGNAPDPGTHLVRLRL